MWKCFLNILLSGLLLATAGCLPRKQHYSMRSGDIDGYSYKAMWHVRPDPDEVVHVVFVPFGATYGSFGAAGLNHDTPLSKGISTFPDGLFVDGVRVPTGGPRRVFVYTKERKMRPILLEERELTALDSAVFENLSESEVWKTKILPVLEEEKWYDPKE